VPRPDEFIRLSAEKSETDRLAGEFCAGTLPKGEWTHEAHLRVGLWHLLQFPPEEALEVLRRRICAYNVATGGANTESSGYHETITRFYVWRIDRFLAGVDRSLPIDELARVLIERHGDRELPLRYWSREKLMAREARRDWVEPDLAPLTE